MEIELGESAVRIINQVVIFISSIFFALKLAPLFALYIKKVIWFSIFFSVSIEFVVYASNNVRKTNLKCKQKWHKNSPNMLRRQFSIQLNRRILTVKFACTLERIGVRCKSRWGIRWKFISLCVAKAPSYSIKYIESLRVCVCWRTKQ